MITRQPAHLASTGRVRPIIPASATTAGHISTVPARTQLYAATISSGRAPAAASWSGKKNGYGARSSVPARSRSGPTIMASPPTRRPGKMSMP